MSRQQATQLLTDLFDGWYPSLLRYAYRLTGSLERAEDVVQEAFLLLYRDLIRGVNIDNPKGWTLVVVRREVARRARDESRHGIQVPLEQAESAAQPQLHPQLESLLFGNVLSMFSVLSPREEEVLLLRIEALKYREIGELLGITANSVTTLLSRALKKLKLAAASDLTRSTVREAHVRKTLL